MSKNKFIFNNVSTPCYQCKERYMLCQAECSQYIKYRSKIDKENYARLKHNQERSFGRGDWL